MAEQLYRATEAGIEEVPLPCPAGHEATTPAWGSCPVDGCWEMGRQWRCTVDGCGKTTQHDHEHRSVR